MNVGPEFEGHKLKRTFFIASRCYAECECGFQSHPLDNEIQAKMRHWDHADHVTRWPTRGHLEAELRRTGVLKPGEAW